jgi:hypothetical protein
MAASVESTRRRTAPWRRRRAGALAVISTVLFVGLGAGCTVTTPSRAEPVITPRPSSSAPSSPSVPTTQTGPSTTRTTTPPTTAAFPLRPSSDHRYLVDANGRPFLLQGDAAWSLIAQLRTEDVDKYLDDRKARGFNTILVSLLEHKFASNAPSNIYGDAPFTKPGDYSTPNEAYFAHADWVLQRAAEKGFLVLLTPSYMGYGGGDEGWYQEMEANGADKLRSYGRFLGQRYHGLSNIIWVQGGDYNPPDKSLADAIAEGLAETMPGALQTAHTAPGFSASSYWGDRSWLTLDNVYTDTDTYSPSVQLYKQTSRPFFLIESIYENEHGIATQGLRSEAYGALLGGATGQVFGNNPMWHFDGPGLFDTGMTWQEALASRGAQSMTHLQQLFADLAWWKLHPDVNGTFLTAGVDSSGGRAAAAIASDGSLGVVYVPSQRRLTLDLGVLAGTNVTLTWYDPSSGASIPATASPASSAATYELEAPGGNADGAGDWVLIARAG